MTLPVGGAAAGFAGMGLTLTLNDNPLAGLAGLGVSAKLSKSWARATERPCEAATPAG